MTNFNTCGTNFRYLPAICLFLMGILYSVPAAWATTAFTLHAEDVRNERQTRHSFASGAQVGDLEQVSLASSHITLLKDLASREKGGPLEIGFFDAEIAVRPAQEGVYPVDFKIGFRMLGEDPRYASATITLQPDQVRELVPEITERLAGEFSGLVADRLSAMGSEYGENFKYAAEEFALNHAIETFRNAPSVVAEMIQEMKPSVPAVPSDDEIINSAAAGSQTVLDFEKPPFRASESLRVNQENYQREEILSIADVLRDGAFQLVPEFRSSTSFFLTATGQGFSDKYRYAKINYDVTTLPLPDGRMRTTFELVIDYLMRAEIATVKTFIHDPEITETEFFEDWKQNFLQEAMRKLLENTGSDESIKLRRLFVTYLEPYLFEEFYDFSPFLVRAQYLFLSESTQKHLTKLKKKRSKASPKKENLQG